MLSASWNVFLELAPWLLLGTVVAAGLHVLLPAGLIHRRLRGPRGVVEAVVLGVPLPLCSCGVIPAGIGLKKDGASDGPAVGFLISTPQTGVDSILIAATFLGWPFAIFKMLAALVTGLVGGWLVELFGGPPSPATEENESPELQVVDTPASAGRSSWREAFEHGLMILRSIWLWVLLGVVASAAITELLPKDVLARVDEWGGVVPALLALAVSLPLYVCATSSVPIAAALVAQGLSTGTALVFLMAGPATNVATIGAVHRSFGRFVTAVYLGTIIVGSVAFAMLFDWLLPSADAVAHLHGHEHVAWWSWPPAVVLAGLFAWFAFDDLRRLSRRGADRELAEAADAIRVPVDGMTCNGCTSKLTAALERTEGVENVVVQLEPGEAIVCGDVDEETIRSVVREAGFRDVRERVESELPVL